MQPVRIAVIIPAGPRDNILDTLASVIQYTDSSRAVLVVDDTATLPAMRDRIREMSDNITVIPAPAAAPGGYGGLWVKLATGYRWLLERFVPELILRLDADALMLAPGIEAAAGRVFSQGQGIGLLGSYRLGPDGGIRDFAPAARALRSETGIRGLTHPKRWSELRRYVRLARTAGYVQGEHALGGAYIHSIEAARCLYQRGWLDQPFLATSKLGEDMIMALLTRAAGFTIGDFGGPDHPMAVRWRGLPAHPLELLSAGKLVTHSVRSWEDLTEQDIRSIFASARTGPLSQ